MLAVGSSTPFEPTAVRKKETRYSLLGVPCIPVPTCSPTTEGTEWTNCSAEEHVQLESDLGDVYQRMINAVHNPSKAPGNHKSCGP